MSEYIILNIYNVMKLKHLDLGVLQTDIGIFGRNALLTC